MLKLDKTPQWGPREAAPTAYFAKFGIFDAAILYSCGHIPTNAHAILAVIYQQEFKHPKLKHPSGIPKVGPCPCYSYSWLQQVWQRLAQ